MVPCAAHKREAVLPVPEECPRDGLLYRTGLQPSDLHTSDLHTTKESSYPKKLPHMTETVPDKKLSPAGPAAVIFLFASRCSV